MNYWIFQGNPDKFDIETYVGERDKILWSVRQTHLANEINVGDEVFIWKAGGKNKTIAGVVALGVITDSPSIQPDDAASLGLWVGEEGNRQELRVPIQLHSRCLGNKDIVRRQWLHDDPILSELRILRMRTETNYRINGNEAHRLALLCRNTGRDWSRDECVAALWAYSMTEGLPISKLRGQPVSKVAIDIGRAVSGVYNKLMNYRSIDPRDDRKGFSSTSVAEHEARSEFFDSETQVLDRNALEGEYERMWGSLGSLKVVTHPKMSYTDFGEAPDDDPSELKEFALRVRRGQAKFRKRLLYLYNAQCAISECGPEEVLEAAHIDDHSSSGLNKSENGLLLRADLHILLDAGLIKIEPESMKVRVDRTLQQTEYWSYDGIKIRDRIDGKRPSKSLLRKRWEK